LILIWSNFLPAFAQANDTVSTKKNATVFAGPGIGFDTISVLEPNVQVTIIPPSSVIIGEGVTIGEGTLIEGKPWINIRLPDGRSGYVKGSAMCSKIENKSYLIALCAN
jgi:UDP-3-O-[3-hydroxymyristoyl] glucosamine N-acyltransferase